MRVLAAPAVLVLVAGCQTAPQEMTEAEIAQVQTEVAAVGDQWLAAANGVNTEVFLDLFDPAGTHATDGAHYANHEEWVGRVERLFSTWEELSWAWTTSRVVVFSSDAAMFVGQCEGTVIRTNGTTSDANVGATLLMRNVGGVWKIIYQGTAGRFTPSEEG